MQPDVWQGWKYVVLAGVGVMLPLGVLMVLGQGGTIPAPAPVEEAVTIWKRDGTQVMTGAPRPPAPVDEAHARAEARRSALTAALQETERVRAQACAVARRTSGTLGVTLAAYQSISTGEWQDWHLEDLTCLFGMPGEELSQAGLVHLYRWRAPLGGGVVLTLKEALGLGSDSYYILSKAQRDVP